MANLGVNHVLQVARWPAVGSGEVAEELAPSAWGAEGELPVGHLNKAAPSDVEIGDSCVRAGIWYR